MFVLSTRAVGTVEIQRPQGPQYHEVALDVEHEHSGPAGAAQRRFDSRGMEYPTHSYHCSTDNQGDGTRMVRIGHRRVNNAAI